MAGSPIITCPECRKKFKGKGDLRGKKIRCPFCGDPFVVPVEEETGVAAKPSGKKPAKSPPSAKAQAARSKHSLDEDDEDNPNPYGITELDLAPRCPNCANEMESEEAVVCLFCGYNTLTRAWGKTEKIIAHTGGEHFMYLLPGLLCALFLVFQVISVIYYCLVLPYVVEGGWFRFSDHESMRVWTTVISLGVIWPVGYFVLKRLVLKPTPPEKVKE